MVVDIDDVNVAVYTILAADSTLTSMLGSVTSIYDGLAPDGAAYPVVVFGQPYPLTSTDKQVMTGSYVTIYKVDVKAIAGGTDSGGVAGRISKRVHEILENANLPLPQGSTFYCRRSGDFSYPEEVDNTRFSHVGGTYQIEVAP